MKRTHPVEGLGEVVLGGLVILRQRLVGEDRFELGKGFVKLLLGEQIAGPVDAGAVGVFDAFFDDVEGEAVVTVLCCSRQGNARWTKRKGRGDHRSSTATRQRRQRRRRRQSRRRCRDGRGKLTHPDTHHFNRSCSRARLRTGSRSRAGSRNQGRGRQRAGFATSTRRFFPAGRRSLSRRRGSRANG